MICVKGSDTRLRLLAGLLAVLVLPGLAAAQQTPSTLPTRLSDAQFWAFITRVSEPGGYFRSDNFLSNEAAYQYVIPDLLTRIPPDGVYLGVGPEQNFTYIVAFKPRMAVIFDIRRGNLLEHLLYKALFELAADRADFLSLLFSRPRPEGLDTATSVDDLFRAYAAALPDSERFQRTMAAVRTTLVRKHGFQLDSTDLGGMHYVLRAFFVGGPTIDYWFPNTARMGMPDYADLMTEDDSLGVQRGFLANEANYRAIQAMEARNMVVPVVGDFAGPKAIRAVGNYLKAHGATANVFYTSNVEQYLFRQGDDWSRYYDNVATLPLDSTSTFIRSVTGGFMYRFQPGRPFIRLRSVRSSMLGLVELYGQGWINSYFDVITYSH